MAFYFLFFIFGAIFGSFLNSVIYRIESAKGIFSKTRSFCPECGHDLSWKDLFPLLSYVVLKGKCRYCQSFISWQYPFVEFSSGLIAILVFSKISGEFFSFQWIFGFVFSFAVFLLLLAISIIDFKTLLIHDVLSYPLLFGAFFYLSVGTFLGYFDWTRFWLSILAGFIFGAVFLVIVLISRETWMGAGDVKLAVFMGIFLGFEKGIIAMFLAFLLGAIIGIFLILSRKKKRDSQIPLGPFLALGTLLVFVWGENLWNWYFNLIFNGGGY